ncbi:unnamed protein product [Diplocarpon coronariae]|uniref:RGS domain-containing protein n=1 Tax=Diplocarpon coronariae TaxID=2795749 RepID=A0A218YVG3_9HELO|nr:hypothetical protein B2J93_1134 [Marssonina coronariae]
MMPRYPDWLRWYKKPSYVDVNQFATAINKGSGALPNSTNPRSSTMLKRRSSTDIPSKLSLEKILNNRTCSPMSLYDFYMYLKYIEHSSENLEFYIWFKNFEAGRLTAFPELPRTPTPIHGNISGTSSETNLARPQSDEKSPEAIAQETETEAQDYFNFEGTEIYAQMSSFISHGGACGPKVCQSRRLSPVYKRPFSVVEKMEAEAEAKTSTEIQDMRRVELETVRKLFLLPGSPKELNIPDSMRRKVLDAIATSTEAANLVPVAEHCYLLLRSCSHRNFIRLGVSNGTFETICVATGLGIFLTIGGFMAMVLLALVTPSFRHCSRWRGLAIWPMWSVGLGLILSGIRGSCFFLLLFSRRQPLPWEKFEDDPVVRKESKITRVLSRLMIFDRKLKVKDSNLRRLQRKVVMQSLLGGMSFATLMVTVCLALPIWEKV